MDTGTAKSPYSRPIQDHPGKKKDGRIYTAAFPVQHRGENLSLKNLSFKRRLEQN
jgi:hypothetical protein